jgi:hypothetical protein
MKYLLRHCFTLNLGSTRGRYLPPGQAEQPSQESDSYYDEYYAYYYSQAQVISRWTKFRGCLTLMHVSCR